MTILLPTLRVHDVCGGLVRKARRLAALCVAALALGANAPAMADQVVARVNKTPITLGTLDRELEGLLRERGLHMARLNNPAQLKGMRREALDRLVRNELLWQEAKVRGLAASDEDVARSVAETKKQLRTESAFDRHLIRMGLDEAGYRDHVRKLLSGDRVAQRIVERQVKVNDDDVQAFYAANPRLFKREEQVRVRQILLRVEPGATPQRKNEQRVRLEALAARVRAGESMEALAREHTDDATRQWGGELDPFARQQQPRAIEDAAFALKAPGELSPVFETERGWHLLQLIEHTEAREVPLTAVRERIRGHLVETRGRDAIEQAVEKLRAAAKVDIVASL
jgi:parvulin-like peptidyl-prolyl isomerase